MKAAIKVDNLNKKYGSHHVLRGITFEVLRGETFALLGANGAGKSTALECIEGLRSYESGSIQISSTLGVQIQSSSIAPECKVKEAIKLFGLWNGARKDDFADPFSIGDIKDKKYGTLSVGQKKKLHLTLALLGNPAILILDEPTAGLDVESRVQLHGEIRNLKRAGKTIILASHDMAEVEELCDRLAIMRGGKIAFCGSPDDLRGHVKDKALVSVSTSKPLNMAEFVQFLPSISAEGLQLFRTDDTCALLAQLAASCSKSDTEIIDIEVKRESLEKRFLEISKEHHES